MFGLFKKKEHPLPSNYKDFSINQKMSVLNLLVMIASCDNNQQDEKRENNYLSEYNDILNVDKKICLSYLKEKGLDGLLNDLIPLQKNYKEQILLAVFGLITEEGRQPNKIEIQSIKEVFEKISIKSYNLIKTVEKLDLQFKHSFN